MWKHRQLRAPLPPRNLSAIISSGVCMGIFPCRQGQWNGFLRLICDSPTYLGNSQELSSITSKDFRPHPRSRCVTQVCLSASLPE